MNDISLLRDHPDRLADALRRRHLEVDIDALRELDEKRRAVRSEAEEMRSRQKDAGKEIAKLDGDAKQAAIAEMSDLADRYKERLGGGPARCRVRGRLGAAPESPPRLGAGGGGRRRQRRDQAVE